MSYGMLRTVRRGELAFDDVQLRDPGAGLEEHTALRIPGVRLEDDFVGRPLGDDTAEKNAIVTAMRLLAEDGDLVSVQGVPADQLVEEPARGHAVADDRQALLAQGWASVRCVHGLKAYGRDLEFRHTADRVQGGVGQQIHRLAAAPVERGEHRVRSNGRGDFDFEDDLAAAALD